MEIKGDDKGDAVNLLPSPTPDDQVPANTTKVRNGSGTKRVDRLVRREHRSARKRIFSISRPTKAKHRYNPAARFHKSSSDEDSDTEPKKKDKEGGKDKMTSSSPAPEMSEVDRESLWKRCSRGAAARKRVGPADAAMPVDTPIHTVLQLVPVSVFCATLYKSKQTINATVPKAAVVFQTLYPGTVARIVKATTLVGQAARVEINSAEAETYAAERPHDIFVYALMMYVWTTNEGSKKRELISCAIEDYLRAPSAEEVQLIIDSSERGSNLAFSSSDDDLLGHLDEMPGYSRLDYQAEGNLEACIDAWEDLFTICCNLLCAAVGYVPVSPGDSEPSFLAQQRGLVPS